MGGGTPAGRGGNIEGRGWEDTAWQLLLLPVRIKKYVFNKCYNYIEDKEQEVNLTNESI